MGWYKLWSKLKCSEDGSLGKILEGCEKAQNETYLGHFFFFKALTKENILSRLSGLRHRILKISAKH